MDWKIGYGTLGLIALLFGAGLVWYETVNAPTPVPASIILSSPQTLDPYPEMQGVRIHINSATVEQLQQLPGIGATKAQAIYDLVQHKGKITNPRQLLEAEGIGESTLDRIKPYLIYN